MITRKPETPVCTKTVINTPYSVAQGTSVLKNAHFRVGYKDEVGEVRESHDEPIIPSWMPDRGKEIITNVEAELRELWGIMCDESQYYDRAGEISSE